MEDLKYPKSAGQPMSSSPSTEEYPRTELELFASILKSMGVPLTKEDIDSFMAGDQARLVADKLKTIWQQQPSHIQEKNSKGTQAESSDNDSDPLGIETAIGGIGRFVYEHMQQMDQRFGSFDSAHNEQSSSQGSVTEQQREAVTGQSFQQTSRYEGLGTDSAQNSVVRTTTTTHHTLDKNGNKETRVVVETHFDDGSKAVTESVTTEIAPWWRGDADEGIGASSEKAQERALGDEPNRDNREQGVRECRKTTTKKSKPKGWFWE